MSQNTGNLCMPMTGKTTIRYRRLPEIHFTASGRARSLCIIKNFTSNCTLCTKRIMFSLEIDGEWIEIKFKVETKFKMAAIANFVGWRHKSSESSPCNWKTLRYCLFCCYNRRGRCVNCLGQITDRLLFFSIKTEPPKRLLEHYLLVTHITGHIDSLK